MKRTFTLLAPALLALLLPARASAQPAPAPPPSGAPAASSPAASPPAPDSPPPRGREADRHGSNSGAPTAAQGDHRGARRPGAPPPAGGPPAPPDGAAPGGEPGSAAAAGGPPPAEKAAPIDVQVIGASDDALQKLPGSGAIVGAKDVARAQPVQMGELVRRVSGVRVLEEEGSGLRLNIGVRGLDPTRSRRVLLLEDGVPVAINPYGEPDAYYSTPVERIRAIEVVKGSGSILFGPQSVGGVVNFLTISAPNEARVTLDAQLGERLYRRGLVRYGDTVGDVRFVAQAMYKGSDGVRGMGFDAVDALAKVSFPTSARGEATLKVSVYNEASSSTYVGLTQPMFLADPRQPTLAPADRFDVRRYDVSLVHEHQFSGSTKLRTMVFGYVTDRVWRRQLFDREPRSDMEYPRIAGDPNQPGGAIFFRDSSLLNDRKYDVAGVEPVLTHRFETAGIRHTLTAGARYLTEGARRRQYFTQAATSSSGDLYHDEQNRTHAFAAYAQDRIAFRDWLLVTPGVRLEHAQISRHLGRVDRPEDVDVSGDSSVTSVLPGLGVVIGTPALNGYAGFFQGFAPPRVAAAISPSGTDRQLGAERSNNYEVGVRAAPWKWARVEATLFLMNFENQLVSGSLAGGDETELVNGGATRHMGAEASASFKLGKLAKWGFDLDLTGQYTFARGVFASGLFDGNILPYSPQHSAAAILDFEHPVGAGAQLSWSFIGDQFTDDANSIEPDVTGRTGLVPAYSALDMVLRYTHAGTGLTGTLTVKNLLDQVVVVTRRPDGIFTGGFRQITAGLRWEMPSPGKRR